MPTKYDVIIAGAGPAGSACATFCARDGMRVLVIERAVFPREKVCGDCLNPSAWPVLERIGVVSQLQAEQHAPLREVEFIGIDGLRIVLPLPQNLEIAIKRSLLDRLLLDAARAAGAEIVEGATVTGLKPGWTVETDRGIYRGMKLVGADGRNSSVARILGMLPPARKDRVGVQTHLPMQGEMRERVRLQFRPEGYCGMADVGGDELNLCLVTTPENLGTLKWWAVRELNIPDVQMWRSIAPLTRSVVSTRKVQHLLLIGDAARVIEPFTGEGISYALRSGELAADHLAGRVNDFEAAHRALYRRSLWVNQLAKTAVLHPGLATRFLHVARHYPSLLRFLTTKVVG